MFNKEPANWFRQWNERGGYIEIIAPRTIMMKLLITSIIKVNHHNFLIIFLFLILQVPDFRFVRMAGGRGLKIPSPL